MPSPGFSKRATSESGSPVHLNVIASCTCIVSSSRSVEGWHEEIEALCQSRQVCAHMSQYHTKGIEAQSEVLATVAWEHKGPRGAGTWFA